MAELNNGPAALNDADEQYDECHDEEKVDESTQRVATDDSEQPQD